MLHIDRNWKTLSSKDKEIYFQDFLLKLFDLSNGFFNPEISNLYHDYAAIDDEFLNWWIAVTLNYKNNFYELRISYFEAYYQDDYKNNMHLFEVQSLLDNVNAILKDTNFRYYLQTVGNEFNIDFIETQSIEILLHKLVSNHNYEINTLNDFEKDLSHYENTIKEYFIEIFGADIVNNFFNIPLEYYEFLKMGKSLSQKDEDYDWRKIYDYDISMYTTLYHSYEYAISDLKERISKNNLNQNDTFWVNVGYWSDRHEYYICCDISNPLYRKIFDFNDCSPYGGKFESYSDSFLTFLETLNCDKKWKY